MNHGQTYPALYNHLLGGICLGFFCIFSDSHSFVKNFMIENVGLYSSHHLLALYICKASTPVIFCDFLTVHFLMLLQILAAQDF